MTKHKTYTLDRIVRISISIVIFSLFLYLLNRLSSVLVPFAVASIFAYLINPLVNLLQKKMIKNRGLAVFTSLFLIGGVLTGLVFLLIPLMSTEIKHMIEIIHVYADSTDEIEQSKIYKTISQYVSQEKLEAFLTEEKIFTYSKEALSYFGDFFTNTINILLGLVGLVTISIYTIFILLDFEKMTLGWKTLIPAKYRKIVIIAVEDLNKGMNAYFRAQAFIALIVGILFAIGFSITGLPMAILFGLFVGVLNMVPYMQMTAFIPAFILAFFQSIDSGNSFWYEASMVLVVFSVIQLIQETILIPKFMGKVTGLNPAIILLSLSIWGSLLGILGMLIALPVTTIIYSYYKRYIAQTETDEELHLFD